MKICSNQINFTGSWGFKPPLDITSSDTGSFGNLWFDGVNLKYSKYIEGWAILSNSLSTTRRYPGGAGTDIAALAFGGCPGSFATEEYNGSSWSSGGSMINRTEMMGDTGTQNAALSFGGYGNFSELSCTEEYNGTSWATGGSLISSRKAIGGAGTQNSGLAAGGGTCFDTCDCTEEYNGTSWAQGSHMNNPTKYHAMSGTQNASLANGGYASFSINNCTEEYNGTSWSNGPASTDYLNFRGGTGTTNDFMSVGGNNYDNNSYNACSCVEAYNGTSWSSSPGIPVTMGGHGMSKDSSTGGASNGSLAFGSSPAGSGTCTLSLGAFSGSATMPSNSFTAP